MTLMCQPILLTLVVTFALNPVQGQLSIGRNVPGPEPEPESESIADFLPAQTNHLEPTTTTAIKDVEPTFGGDFGGGFGPDPSNFNNIDWLENFHALNPCACCVANSECVFGTCQCVYGYTGDGFFHCVNETEHYYCRGKADPAIRTLAGENYVHHLIGSSRLAQLTTQRNPHLPNPGTCKFWLWGSTDRIKGKYFYSGLTFRLDQEYQDEYQEWTQDSRRGHIQTTAGAGDPYSWNVRVYGPEDPEPLTDSFTSNDTTPFNANIGGCEVVYERITQDFMMFNLQCCGISFALRQYHPDFHGIVPGFYLQVRKDHNPTYETWENNGLHTEPLCLDHTKTRTVKDLVRDSGVTSGKRDALTYHAVTNSAFTEYPGAPDGLALLKILLRDCAAGKRSDLLNLIRFFFDNPKLSKCLNGDGDDVSNSIEGIEYAASLVCNDAVDGCEPLTNLITVPECSRVIDEFPEIEALAYPDLCTGQTLHDDFSAGTQDGFHWGHWG